ncbi:hypothetical protein G7046_g8778 [Stylonectria norvegica]|nr:hypothetical protein G7046_g8778 [Stylonectria norvegica]
MRRVLSAALGALALLSTAAILSIHIVLALHTPPGSTGRTIAKVSAALEAVVLIVIAWLLSTYASASLREWSTRCLGVVFGFSLFAIAFAAAASVGTIYLSHSTADPKDNVLGANQTNFLIGSSVALGLSCAFQLTFVVINFIFARASGLQGSLSLHSLDDDRKSPAFRVKTVRYSHTSPDMHPTREMNSMDSRSPPPSVGGRSRAGTVTSIRMSFSSAIRPVTSKTQLLSAKEKRRPASLDSIAYRTSGEDAFDTWDTSSVDTHNRLAVLEASSPPHATPHFLETIPGSPTASRTPSPSNSIPLEPPRMRTRSRSYSPASIKREQPYLTQQVSASELNIHPLFRSDSPTPPPVATPGTVVVASPNAGQVITHRQSLRSLNQMRGGSALMGPSPLSARASLDSKKHRDEQGSLYEVEEEPALLERTMTPPIPDWVLSAPSTPEPKSRRVHAEGDAQ